MEHFSIKVGCDVIKRSKVLFILVGSKFTCSINCEFNIEHNFSQCNLSLSPDVGLPYSQSISPRLKSPPRKILQFRYFSLFPIFPSEISSSFSVSI